MRDAEPGIEHCRAADAAEAAAYADMFDAAPAGFAAAVGLRVVSIGGAKVLIAPGLPTPMFNRVIGLGTFEPSSAEALDRIDECYRTAGVRTYWISVSPAAQPRELAGWLESRGFAPPKRRAWVQMRWGDAAPPAVATTLDVGDARVDETDDVARAVAAAFEMPPPIAGWLAALARRDGWKAFAARGDGRIVGGGFVYTLPPLAWLGMGAVLPEHRGRNGQLALFAARIAHARSQGCRSIHTETGEPVADEPNPSFANMARFGFERVASRTNYSR